MIISNRYGLIFIKSSKCAGTSIELFLDPLCDESDVVTPFWHPERGHRPRNFHGWFNPARELRVMGRFLGGSPHDGPTPTLRKTLWDFRERRRFSEAMPAWQVRCRIGEGEYGKYFAFAVERNPWDKVLSRLDHWNDTHPGSPRLEVDGLLDHLEARAHSPLFQLAPVNYPRYADPFTGRLLVDRVCRYESLNDELAEVFAARGVPFEGHLGPRAKACHRADRRPYRERLTRRQGARIGDLFHREIDVMGYRW